MKRETLQNLPKDCRNCVDRLLAEVAPKHRSVTDHLLDLRNWVSRNERAGSCVHAYFEMLGKLPETCWKDLCPLREYLEQRLKITASAKAEVLSEMPVKLDAQDLETFCHEAMESVRRKARPEQGSIVLTIEYRKDSQAA